MNTTLSTTNRRYDIDAVRVLAFLLLIFYHIGMFYVEDWGWHVKSDYQYQWVKYPMLLVNQWRMPLLFLISGIVSSLLLRKLGSAGFLKSRSRRLLIPFFIGVLLVVPPQPYLQAIANGTIAQHFGSMSYLQFLGHYFTFQGWPSNSFDGSEFGFTWNHLWFIPYLFLYTLALLPLSWVLRKSSLEARFDRIGAIGLILVPVLIQILWKLTFNDDKPISHALYDDGYAHAMYGTTFLLGYLISDKIAIWNVITRLRWFALISAMSCFATLLALWLAGVNEGWLDHAKGVIATFNQWVWLVCILAWAAHGLNRPSGWTRYANNRVYPWYILHQTIIIIAGFWLAKLNLGGLLEFTLVGLATVLGCYAITDHVFARSEILKTWFGMK